MSDNTNVGSHERARVLPTLGFFDLALTANSDVKDYLRMHANTGDSRFDFDDGKI